MKINTEVLNGIGTLHMEGRFDFSIQRMFKETYDPFVRDPGIRNIEIDLSQVEYMDSSSLGMLLMLRDRAGAEGKQVLLSRPGRTVSQILEVANFGKLFAIR